MKTFAIHLIDSKGRGSYLSVKGKTEWAKKAAQKHINAIKACKVKPFDYEVIELENLSGC